MPGAPLVKPASITMRTPWPIDNVTDAVTINATDAPITYQRYGARYRSAALRLPSLRLDARSSMTSNGVTTAYDERALWDARPPRGSRDCNDDNLLMNCGAHRAIKHGASSIGAFKWRSSASNSSPAQIQPPR